MKKVAILFIVLLTSSFVFAQNTYVPDDKFEQALIDLGYDTTLDDYVVTANISGVTSLHQLESKEISDLTGIQDFIALTNLNVYGNQLTSLDVSKNTALEILNVDRNQLTSLDVSKNTALTLFSVGTNKLTNLDVSKNTALTVLSVNSNQLTSLDVSKNTALNTLGVGDNQLTSLDVNMITGLKILYVNQNELTSLDVSKNTALTALVCGENKLTSLDVSNNTALTQLSVKSSQFTTLDVTANTALLELRCSWNQLTSLDVSKNTALTWLSCHSNQLTSLDVNNNTALTYLDSRSNQLTSLNIRNGVTDALSKFMATSNSDLTCIETLDPAYATTNWTNIDVGVTFSVICGDLTRLHVATTGSDGSGSGTETSPLATIQTGINAASSGDTVLVSAGTYKENINYSGKNISVRSTGGPLSTIMVPLNSSIPVVRIINNENSSALLSGFTIKDGGNVRGSAIKVSGSSPIIENCIIKDCNNTTDGSFGAISTFHATPEIRNCLIYNNVSGIMFDSQNPTTGPKVINCTVVNNTQKGLESAAVNGIPEIINSIIFNNSTNTQGSLDISYSLIEGGFSGEGNIDANPQFVKVITTGDEESDYHLSDWSPAIGAGTATGAPTTDIEGNPRPNPSGSNPDMGAFENQYGTPQNALPVIATQSDLTIAEDGTSTATLTATDADGDAITYSAVSDTNAVTVSVSSSTLTLTQNANWHGVANMKAYASDGTDKDSTSFKLTVTPVQDAPYAFEWVSSALDAINITKENLNTEYIVKWTTSNEVDGETIDYLISASVGQFPAEMINETADTSMTITYQDIIDNWYTNLAMLSRATLKFTVVATDGIDTVNVTGDDRVLFVNRYEYLSTEGEGVPVEFALHENYPNPFNPTTTLRFDLPEVSDITLTIYNMLGQKVRTFNYQNTSAGYHSVKWNATNDYGDPVGAGVYLYQLQTKDFVKTRKMVLLK